MSNASRQCISPAHRMGRIAAVAMAGYLALALTACGGSGTTAAAPAQAENTPPATQAASSPVTPPVVVQPVAPPDRTAADVTFTQTTFGEGVSIDPATGSLYIGTGGASTFALLRATATETAFSNWLGATGIIPGAPTTSPLVVGTRVQGSAIYFCVSTPFPATGTVWAYNLDTQAKVGQYAMPAGFCNDLAFDAAGNLFATSNRITSGSEAIYKLSAAKVATGSATAADWATWYSAPAGFAVNGLTFDATGNRLLWADNSTPLGNTRIQASATGGATATATSVIGTLAMKVDGLQINGNGNLLAIDASTGAKLINLGTGTLGTVTNLTDGAACRTTVALYKADAWCSDSTGTVIRLVGAGNL
jgi:hypothetical protein